LDPIWLKQYPAGVPATVDPDQYTSLRHLIDEAFATYRDHPAFSNMGTTLDFAALDRDSRAFGAWLQSRGFRPGDRVALMMPNILQYPVALFGALRAGCTVVNTNPLYTPRELEHQLADSGATAIVILENFAHVLQEVLPRTQVRTVIVTAVGDLLRQPRGWLVNFVLRHVQKKVPRWAIPATLRLTEVIAAGQRLGLAQVEAKPGDIAFLQYTGGTTGISKGAILTHRNMIANVLQAKAWIGGSLPPVEGRIVITALPLYHIFSLTANCLLFCFVGAHNILITNPRDFPAFVAELRRHRFYFISGVNTLFNALLHQEGFDRLDFSGLRVTLGGGMAVQRAVATRWKEVTGCVLTQAWGLTETSPAACINPVGLDYNGAIGLPISSTEVSIRDDDGHEIALGQSGEICVRGPQVMAGYWRRPDETAQVFFGEWLRTGDIGHVDAAGFVYIDDRKKDMILVSGFNVYPNEVEDVVATHPGVREVAAVAQPDNMSGEAVALFVVRKDPALSAAALIEHCRHSLTGYKVPHYVYFREELPKTNVGKILRRALREELAAAGAAGPGSQPGT
jgi:long-chain acyl-CoA synthetase